MANYDVLFEIDATVTLAALLTIRVLVTLATQIEISGTKTVLLDRFHPGKHFWDFGYAVYGTVGNLVGVSRKGKLDWSFRLKPVLEH